MLHASIVRSSYPSLAISCIVGFLFFLSVACVRSPWSYSDDSGLQPKLSVDTIRLDTLYSSISSTTQTFLLYNPYSEGLRIQEICLLSGGYRGYRLNVDGRSGARIEGLSIAPQDSMFVFIEATFAEGDSDFPTLITDSLCINCNGVTSYTRIEGYRQNVHIVPSSTRLSSETEWSADRPYLITDSLIIDANTSLRLPPGGHILLREEGRIIVHGALLLEGAADRPILIEGLRRDNLTNKTSYRLLPNQWRHIYFAPESTGNYIRHAIIRNGQGGLFFAPGAADDLRLTLESSVVTNMGSEALHLCRGRFEIVNSELSNSRGALLKLAEASLRGAHLSVVNDYLFDHRLTPSIVVGGGSRLTLTHSIVDGTMGQILQQDTLVHAGELAFVPRGDTQIDLQECYLHLGTDSVQALQILQCYFPTSYLATKPLRESYRMTGQEEKRGVKNYHFLYDYRPLESSPIPSLAVRSSVYPTDLLGIPRQKNAHGGYTLGAYECVSNRAPAPWWALAGVLPRGTRR